MIGTARTGAAAENPRSGDGHSRTGTAAVDRHSGMGQSTGVGLWITRKKQTPQWHLDAGLPTRTRAQGSAGHTMLNGTQSPATPAASSIRPGPRPQAHPGPEYAWGSQSKTAQYQQALFGLCFRAGTDPSWFLKETMRLSLLTQASTRQEISRRQDSAEELAG